MIERIIGDTVIKYREKSLESPPPSRIIKRTAFINSFSDVEIQGFLSKAKTSPEIEVFLFRLKTAGGDIDLDSPHITNAMAAMVTAGVINQERADALKGNGQA